MQSLILYLAILAFGAFVGAKRLSPEKEYKWIGKVQFVAIMILVTAMGIRIGANDRVISSLADIGISAFVVTAFVMAGSLAATFFVRKYFLKMDKKGVLKKQDVAEADSGEERREQ